jgi:hypothetical protein
MRLGSPAPAYNANSPSGWLAKFMAQVPPFSNLKPKISMKFIKIYVVSPEGNQ